MKVHVVTAAIAALVVSAQSDPPPVLLTPSPTPDPTDWTTSPPPLWTPTTTMPGTWNTDWTWSNSYVSGGSAGSDGSAGSWSGSGSGMAYPRYDDDAGVEVMYPNLDGSLDHVVRHNYYFDKSRGFRVSARDGVTPGQCPFQSCIHLVFESDYGAMTPFDAFVLDRVESANGPVDLLTDAWDVGGPVPLVLGRLSNETRDRIQGDYAFNWNETRRTTWTLHPINGMDEIDVTLSLKQLYTMLPGYNGTDPASDGPFYSADLTDQVIIRVNGQVASPSAGASAMLPIVVNHTGSQLVDINLTSTLLYDGPGVNGGNEIELVFTLTRRRYGGAMPWFPAKPSPECQACMDDRRLPDAFTECLDDQLARQHLVFQDLLSPDNDRTMLHIGTFGKACLQAIANGDWVNGTNTTAPTRIWDGLQWLTVDPPDPVDVEKRKAILQQTDDAIRCWSESQCAIGGGNLKSDAQVILLRHEPARTVIDFNQHDFSFYLQLQLDGPMTPNEMFTTPVMGSALSADEIAQFITTAMPGSDSLGLDIEVLKYNNSQEIADIVAKNQWAMDMYNRGMQSAASAASTDGGSDSDSDSAGDGGSVGEMGGGSAGGSVGEMGGGSAGGSVGEVGGGSAGGSVGSQSSSSGPSAGWSTPQLMPPTPRPVPPETYTIEIRSLNTTTVLSVVAVLSDNAQATYHTTDDALWFKVAPLDVTQFEYVPPPPYVDLHWEGEPVWIRDLRRRLPSFASNDSCGQCMDAFEACLFDLDCAYGVNDYVNTALRPYQLVDKVQYNQDSKSESVYYTLDVSELFRKAKAFFPARSYAKFEELVTCWAVKMCNLDDDRWIYYQDTGEYQLAEPTVFQTGSSFADITVDQNETFTFTYFGSEYNYTIDGDQYQLQAFIRDVVLQNEPLSVRDVFVKTYGVTDSGQIRFEIVWPNVNAEGFSIAVHGPNSSVAFMPGGIEIRTVRQRMIDVWTVFEWPRLEQWLMLFWYVPSSSFPSPYPGYGNGNGTYNNGTYNNGTYNNDPYSNGTYSNGTYNNGTYNNGTNDWNYTDPNLPVPAPPSSSVCWACSDLLYQCVNNNECASAVQWWLPSLFPTTSPSLDFDDIYRAYWNMKPDSTGTSQPYNTSVFSFLTCVAKRGCAVGARNVTGSNYVMPTTLQFQATRTINIAKGQAFRMYYLGLYIFQTDDATDGLQKYLDLVQNQNGERLAFSKYDRDDRVDITFTGSRAALDNLKFLQSTPSYGVSDVGYKMWFESHKPVPPSWDFLLAWYGLAVAKPDECPQCVPKLERCYNDPWCWQNSRSTGVQSLLQQLTPTPWNPIATPWSTRYDGETNYFDVFIGAAWRDAWVSSYTQPWHKFTDILVCFAEMKCDTSSMNSALEPPATAHIPSYIQTQGGSALIALYMSTQLRAVRDDQTFDFTETASGFTDPLKSFFENVFQGQGAQIAVTIVDQDVENNFYQYRVEFGDTYFGHLPQLSILSPGNVQTSKDPFATLTPWEVTIEAAEKFPQWDLLTRMLSSPLPPVAPPDNLLQCPIALATRIACHSVYSCHKLVGRVASLVQTQLEKTNAPVFNQDTQVYESDLSPLLTQRFLGASQETLTQVIDLIRESARCAAQSFPPSAAQPVFRDLTLSFNRPAHGDVNFKVGDNQFTFPDDSNDPNVDRIQTFEQFVFSNIIAAAGSTNVSATHSFSELENGVVKHDFEFSRLYLTWTPHLWGVDENGMQTDSIDGPWKVVFQSPTYALNDAFAPWLAWLTTNAQ